MSWDGERQYEKELKQIHAKPPPISSSRVKLLTDLAIEHYKYYKHVVMLIERFVLRSREDYRVSGLFVIDSICRASRKRFSSNDPYTPRFASKLEGIMGAVKAVPPGDMKTVFKVVDGWKQHSTFRDETLHMIDGILGSRSRGSSSANVNPHSQSQPHPSASVKAPSAEAVAKLVAAARTPPGTPPPLTGEEANGILPLHHSSQPAASSTVPVSAEQLLAWAQQALALQAKAKAEEPPLVDDGFDYGDSDDEDSILQASLHAQAEQVKRLASAAPVILTPIAPLQPTAPKVVEALPDLEEEVYIRGQLQKPDGRGGWEADYSRGSSSRGNWGRGGERGRGRGGGDYHRRY
jgi:hypothetical protein